MASESYKTFRVRGIPAGSDKESARKLIADALSCEEDILIRVLSLANDCRRKTELVATVTFSRIPACMQGNLQSEPWSFETRSDQDENSQVSLFFDTHFNGCTPLYSPPDDVWKTDIVAVAGLGGHALGSFKKKNGTYVWLRDSLPQDLMEARIIIYGHDTRLHHSTSFQNIPDLGTKFRSSLQLSRPAAYKRLVLIGHSLGGIVVKEAINCMRASDSPADRENFRALRGVLFFGVPNQGMDITSLIPMVGDQPNRGFLHTLGMNSPVLRNQAQQFSETLSLTNCEVFNFYETRMSPTAKRDENGIWTMSGPPTILVDTFSATHGRLYDGDSHHVFPIDRTHSELVKFEEYDDYYDIVIGQLHQLREPRQSVTSQFRELSETEKDCLLSFAFFQQDWREQELQPINGTCTWLSNHQNFQTWTDSPRDLLWVRGKPGSGKSMLMKWAAQHFKEQERPGQLVASFFFHGQGVDLQKKPVGLYRSIVRQLFRKIPDDFVELTAAFVEKSKTQSDGWTWTENELRRTLATALVAASKKSKIILFVDGLDEAGEDAATEVVEHFERLTSITAGSGPGSLKICFSCRHYPNLTLESGLTISMEDENREDIATVVKDQLLSFSGPEKDRLEDYLVSNAQGIFQWAVLVSSYAKSLKKRGKRIRILYDRIRTIPPGLHQLYESLLEDIDDRKQTIKLFQWIMFSMEPLSLEQLRHALAIDACMEHASIDDYCSQDNFVDDEGMELYINDLSKGLAEIKGSRKVEFIHQSVEDFLLNGGLLTLEGHSNGLAEKSHFQISRSCIRYLSMKEIKQHFTKFETSSLEEPVFGMDTVYRAEGAEAIKLFPFITYAWKWWCHHAIAAKSQDDDNDLLELFCWPHDQDFLKTWVRIRRILGNQFRPSGVWTFPPGYQEFSLCDDYLQIWAWPAPESRLVHFLCLADFHGVVRKMLHDDPNLDLDARDCNGLTPLICAVLGNSATTVHLLVAEGHVDVNISNNFHRSPLHFTSLLKEGAIADDLINGGAIVDLHDVEGFTPLSIAASSGNICVVEKFLLAGADINLRDAEGQTALSSAVAEGHFSVVRQLLYCGANVDSPEFPTTTPLHLAAMRGSVDMVEILTEFGAFVDSKDKKGRTPLSYAAQFGHQNVVVQLLQLGADVNSRSLSGAMPLQMAFLNRHSDACDILRNAGAEEDILSQ